MSTRVSQVKAKNGEQAAQEIAEETTDRVFGLVDMTVVLAATATIAAPVVAGVLVAYAANSLKARTHTGYWAALEEPSGLVFPLALRHSAFHVFNLVAGVAAFSLLRLGGGFEAAGPAVSLLAGSWVAHALSYAARFALPSAAATAFSSAAAFLLAGATLRSAMLLVPATGGARWLPLTLLWSMVLQSGFQAVVTLLTLSLNWSDLVSSHTAA